MTKSPGLELRHHSTVGLLDRLVWKNWWCAPRQMKTGGRGSFNSCTTNNSSGSVPNSARCLNNSIVPGNRW